MAYEIVLKENTSEQDREELLKYLQKNGGFIIKKYNPDTNSFTVANIRIMHKGKCVLFYLL
jgi:hypothetical protein